MSTTLKRKLNVRSGIRESIDRLAAKSKDMLSSYQESHRDELIANCGVMKEMLEELRSLDNELLEYLEDDALKKDVIESRELATRYRVLITIMEAKTKGSAEKKSREVREPPRHKTIQLPYLQLKKFDGNPTEWAAFWDSFASAIDKNPDLEDVQKFNYLKSYLQGNAARALGGIQATNENYAEAISMLKDRFGNKQTVIGSHMSKFEEIKPVKRISDLSELRTLFDQVEANVRSLESFGVYADSYGTFLAPQILKKLPEELRITLMRTLPDSWDLGALLEELKKELIVRERCSLASKPEGPKEYWSSTESSPSTRPYAKQSQATAAALFSDTKRSQNGSKFTCVFCEKEHLSRSCDVVTDHVARREILRKKGKCYVCLRSGHLARKCNSRFNCFKCRGRHHATICDTYSKPRGEGNQSQSPMQNKEAEVQTTANYHVSSENSVLLQTARADVCSPGDDSMTENIRLVFDTGSQKSYVNRSLKDALNLKVIGKERLLIKTFGDETARVKTCDIVQLAMKTVDGMEVYISAYVVPKICSPITKQVLTKAVSQYEHLRGLQLADYENGEEVSKDKQVDLLIGNDMYYLLVEGEIIKGEEMNGPVATKTRLGWVVSGPVKGVGNNENDSHVFQIEAETLIGDDPPDPILKELSKFWEVESVPNRETSSVDKQFESDIAFVNNSYEVKMPFKEQHPLLPDNFNVAKLRLNSLLKKLRADPKIAKEYNRVFLEQLERGIIERVDPNESTEVGKVFYLPHKHVVREDKDTTKLRVVFDASAKREGPSLNDCLYPGPSLLPQLVDILMRFRLKKVVLMSDIEKAFLNVSIDPEQRNFLRFLWVDDVESPDPQIIVFRYTKAIFGAVCSPYLLSATIRHHLRQYEETEPEFVENVKKSLYCDDYVSTFDSESEAMAYYEKLKQCFMDAGFNLRKWKTNSKDLGEEIVKQETFNFTDAKTENLQHESEAKSVPDADSSIPKSKNEKVLGLLWDKDADQLRFEFDEIFKEAKDKPVTKRSILSATAKLFDPLGVLCPIIVPLKILFQSLCKEKVDWDSPVSDEIKEQWFKIINDMEALGKIEIDRPYLSNLVPPESVESIELHGFADASTKAYGACVYIVYRLKNGESEVSLITAKSRVTPLKGETIPRLELLASLILARLITNVSEAVKDVIDIQNVTCWTDSQIALFWIRNTQKTLKPFLQSRVEEIRKLVPANQWKYCPTKQNPADLASRGVSASKLVNQQMWWTGPDFLRKCPEEWPVHDNFDNFPEISESTNRSDLEANIIDVEGYCLQVDTTVTNALNEIIDVERFSDINKLLRVIAYAKRFIANLRAKASKVECKIGDLESSEITDAKLTLVKLEQQTLKQQRNFHDLTHNLGLFEDKEGILRCKGRLENAPIPYDAKFPILLPRDSHVAKLLVLEAHEIVKHNGVQETLAQLRRQYWVVRGRQLVRKLISKCCTCKRFEGRGYKIPPAPSLPKFRVDNDFAFMKIGVDFAGPVFVKNIYGGDQSTYKSYILLLTCASTRALHLELVPDLNAESFKRGFSRFQARRGVPGLIISDNGKTFKDKGVKDYLVQNGINWKFNVEAAPHTGGFFERLVRSTKRCLKKSIRNSKLNYEELLTLLTEIEGVINSRPLTYFNEELGEPLTPSHLIIGRRILDRPSPVSYEPRTQLSHEEVTKRANYLRNVLEHFRGRFSREYLTELREHHRSRKSKNGPLIATGDIVTIFEDKLPRQRWRIGRVEKLLTSKDGQTRSAVVRVSKEGQKSAVIRRPIRRLYPVELAEEPQFEEDKNTGEPTIRFVSDDDVDKIRG